MSIIIAGGTGLIGRRLSEILVKRGHMVHILTRQNIKDSTNIKYFKWSVGHSIDMNVFEGATVIINLTGAGIADKKWTTSRKKELIDSRIEPAKFLHQIMKGEGIHLDLYCSSSGSNYYEDSLEKIYVETDKPGTGFIQKLCADWEEQAFALQSNANRVVVLRTGAVLAKQGSFQQKFTMTTKLGIAGLFGSGAQFVSWIHIDDLCRLYLHAIEQTSMTGAYNAAISHPTSHLQFVKTFLKTSKRKALILKSPKWVSKLVFGELSVLLNAGVAISHQKAKDSGFTFEFEDLETAIKSNLKSG